MNRWAIAMVLALPACSANDDLPSPQISSISPTHAAAGVTVMIAGAYFCHQPADEDPLACQNMGSVSFDASVASVASYADTVIMAEVPSNAGMVNVSVTVAGHLSNRVSFTID